MRQSRKLPNATAQAAAVAAATAEQDAQAAIDSVVVSCMREYVVAQDAKTEADRLAREAGEHVGSVKIAIMLKLAKAAHAGKWGDTAIKTALDAAMLVWAGNAPTLNDTGKEISTEDRLKSPVARKLRSEFNLAMLPEVRVNAAKIIESAAVAWREEEALPVAERVLHKKFWNRPAELQLANLRAAKTVKGETRGRGANVKTEPDQKGTVLVDRAAMVAAIAPVAVAPLDAATAAVKRVLDAIDALAEEYKSTELLAPARKLFVETATAAALVGRLNAIAAAPVPAAAPAPVPAAAPAPVPAAADEPVAGALDPDLIEMALKLGVPYAQLVAIKGK